MMNQKHRKIVKKFSVEMQKQVTRYFVSRGLLRGDVPGADLLDALRLARLGQADVVLCLLRIDSQASLKIASSLVGRSITYCPPLLAMARAPAASKDKKIYVQDADKDRVVTCVVPPKARDAKGRRRLLQAAMYDRLSVAKVGMSVSALVSRGIRRRDLRIAERRGYLTLELRT